MEDRDIIDLFWRRDEQALEQTRKKYGRYCYTVAYNVLRSPEDAQECVNDSYLRLWNAIPPQKPAKLQAFLAKITRNLALNLFEKNNAEKRGSGQGQALLDELQECLAGPDDTSATVVDRLAFKSALQRFLSELSPENKRVFVKRYFYMMEIGEISRETGMGQSAVKMQLLRQRARFKEILKEEGIVS